MLNQLQGVFSSFQEHNVRYVIIGGIAAILHGVPRATFDLDILTWTSQNQKGIQKLPIINKLCKLPQRPMAA